MIKHYLQLFTCILIMSCTNNNKQQFSIYGTTDRVGDAILLKIDPSGNVMDTANIKNGEFRFRKSISEEELFRIQFHDGSSFDILPNLGENIKIDFQKSDLSISGSSGSAKLIELDEELLKLLAFRDSITKELQELSKNANYNQLMLEYKEQFFKKLNNHKIFLKEFIENNKESKACLIALFQTYGRSSPILTIDEDLEDFEKVLNNLKLHFPGSNHIELLEEQIKKFKPLSNGQIAPNFTLPDINQKPVSLSDYKGKVVLIDFWASWCRPCRLESPKLVQLHNKYANLDFDILSISLDGTSRQKDPKQAWEEAIIEDNLTAWKHVSELNGWETIVRELYNFNSIPYTVLVDKDGRIAGKNLRGDQLEIRIKKLLNNGGKK
jgi:thiol-disulfide isomerase/thioredoxin